MRAQAVSQGGGGRPRRRTRGMRRGAASRRAKARVVVVGGGYGGATAAKYLRMLDPSIEVVLVEPNEAFVSCPMSNLVIGGFRTMADITTAYGTLASRHGVRLVRDTRDRRSTWTGARCASRAAIAIAVRPRDRGAGHRLHVGASFRRCAMPRRASAILHAWKAGPQTARAARGSWRRCPTAASSRSRSRGALPLPAGPLRARLPGGGLLPSAAKPRSKVLVLDANGDVTSKAALFKKRVVGALRGHDRVPAQQQGGGRGRRYAHR